MSQKRSSMYLFAYRCGDSSSWTCLDRLGRLDSRLTARSEQLREHQHALILPSIYNSPMLNVERFPQAIDGWRWVVSDHYPINLSPIDIKGANVFGVLPASIDKVFDHEAAKVVVRDEKLLTTALSMLYRSSGDDYWLAQLSWMDAPKLMGVSSQAVQRHIAIAQVPDDLKDHLSGPIQGYRGLLKFPSMQDPAFKLVGVQVPTPRASTY